MTAPRREPADIAERIRQARRAIEQSDYVSAEEVTRAVLAEYSDEPDALYVLAVAQRYQARHEEAFQTLETLRAVAPDLGRAWQETAFNYREQGRLAHALAAFERATTLDPSLEGSWRALVVLHTQSGDERRRRLAQSQLDLLARLPRQLMAIAHLIGDGKLSRAEQLCRSYLAEHPTDVEAMRLLAQIGVRLNILDDAEFFLESALEFAPDHAAIRFEYASVLRRRQKFNEALEQMRQLVENEPGNLAFLRLEANIATAIGDHERALGIYRKLARASPGDEQLHLSCGHALKTIGNLGESIAAYRQAYRVRPDYGDAYWSLANLKTYRFTDEEIALAEAAESAASTPVTDRLNLSFALGKHYEDDQDFARSFEAYDRGNRLRRSRSRYSIEANREETCHLIEACGHELFARRRELSCESPDPIFIVGLPRSGSTLLEQVLASHPQVEGTLELPNIIALAHKLDGRRKVHDPHLYPAVLNELGDDVLAGFGHAYIEDTRVHRHGEPYFTDKMPNNFKHIGLISLILPNAKIIDARRHPISCCFSNFKQLFAEGQEFSYGLEEMANYYLDYVELMEHWDRVLPGKVLRVHYEHVVDDLERQVHRILDHCGLPFDDACVAFHETERAVRTPSAEQVRQPIYGNAREQWRNFEPWLDPLKNILAPVLAAYPAGG